MVSPADSSSTFERLEMSFRWLWRPYQTRVIAALEQHLDDRRLHVVAAPGSGKTVLGLEVFRLLDRPTLVLSPTRTVRDQWIARLADFLPEDAAWPPTWTSTDLSTPSFFTSVTYQALHARTRDRQPDEVEVDEETEEAPPAASVLSQLSETLRQRGIGLLILDEAHHLRNAWWKALAGVIDHLKDVTVVSLTATPPYDALGAEWIRYEALCGPVDEEISVPELVRSGTLCPHQDFVWAVAPTDKERRLVHRHEDAVAEAAATLLAAPELLDAVEHHPWTTEPTPEAVLGHPESAVSLLVYLRARKRELPRPLLELLGAAPDEIPPLDRRWWQVLVEHYLFSDAWAESPDRGAHREQLARFLRKRGLLWRREVRIAEARTVTMLLSLSAAKLDACLAIHDLERRFRGDALRQVFLTDFIRENEQGSLGAWPLFWRLVEHAGPEMQARMALVTGRMVVLHEDALDRLQEAADRMPLIAEPTDGHPAFVRIRLNGGTHRVVAYLTLLLQRGDLHVLIGTKALLGQGWDAPVINSIVLASYVGAFISTNQMRGRAIRTSAADPDKASSIWHLVAVEGSSPSALSDWENLRLRFRCFVGLAERKPVIENGLERLALPDPAAGAPPESINRIAAERLSEVRSLRERWTEAIERGTFGRL